MVSRLKDLFWVSRPLSWVNTAYPFAAGYLVAYQKVDWLFIIGTLYFLIPYNLMMYGINDVFDYESDKRNKRKGGVEGALLDKQRHKLVLTATALINIPWLMLLYGLSPSLESILVLTGVVFGVIAYSAPYLRFKERPFIDSATSSLHFVGPIVYALSFGGFAELSIIIVVSFFLWGLASHAFGAVQDIAADKAGGIGSVATVIGARPTVCFSLLLYAASGLLLLQLEGIARIASIVPFLYVLNVVPFAFITDDKAESANTGWKRFLWLNYLAGFVVTVLLIVIFVL